MMRDRETDSWWSIMQSKAIDGAMKGTPLQETTWGERVTWGDWVRRYPDTRVLSVKGVTHEAENAYQEYFDSPDDTFRDIVPDDTRLRAKEPIFAFRLDGKPHVIPHAAIRGGMLVPLGEKGAQLFFWRAAEAPLFAGTKAYHLTWGPESGVNGERLHRQARERLDSGAGGVTELPGFDTYWYNWVPQNPDTAVLP